MSDVKLEVGQVWEDKTGITTIKTQRTILKIFADRYNGESVAYYHESGIHKGVSSVEIGIFAEDQTLITNAAGTPHTPANDYQAGDVWVFYGKSETPGSAYLIRSGENGLMVSCDYMHDTDRPIEEMSLLANPSNYRLIHRIGVML